MDKKKNVENYIFTEKWKKNKKKIENYRNNYLSDEQSEGFENFAKFCFRLGLLDGIKLLEELKNDSNEDEFFYDEYGDFEEYLETKRINKLLENEEYNELRKEETKIRKKYPNIVETIEGETTLHNLNTEEQTALSELIQIKWQMFNLEKKELYIMGMKEMINILYR